MYQYLYVVKTHVDKILSVIILYVIVLQKGPDEI